MGGFRYDSWRDVPLAIWRWPNFSPEELACHGDGELMVDIPSLDLLQKLRDRIGKPLIVESAFRNVAWNKHVGGVKDSQHLKAKAFDISMSNQDPEHFLEAAHAVGFTGFGTYPDQNFIHIDTGPARYWGKAFPPRPVTVAIETAADSVGEGGEAPAPAAPDRFAPEPKKPSIVESLTKPEVLTPVVTSGLGGILAAFGDLIKTSLPLQLAVSVLIVGVPAGVAIWLVARHRAVRAGD